MTQEVNPEMKAAIEEITGKMLRELGQKSHEEVREIRGEMEFSSMVQTMCDRFLAHHHEIVDLESTRIVMMVYADVLGRLSGHHAQVVKVNPSLEEFTLDRYEDNARALNEDILDLSEQGVAFLQDRFPSLWAVVDEDGGPLLTDAMDDIIANTLARLFGIKRIEIKEPVHEWAIVIENDAPWLIAGLDPKFKVSNTDQAHEDMIHQAFKDAE